MFSLIRGAIVIALIFYFSPARNPDGPEHQGAERAQGSADPSPASKAEQAEALWDRIASSLAEEVVRTTINEKAHAVGLRIPDHGSSALREPSAKTASAATARTSKREPDPPSPGQSVRCVYRCDETE
jgi:hypothetical protein